MFGGGVDDRSKNKTNDDADGGLWKDKRTFGDKASEEGTGQGKNEDRHHGLVVQLCRILFDTFADVGIHEVGAKIFGDGAMARAWAIASAEQHLFVVIASRDAPVGVVSCQPKEKLMERVPIGIGAGNGFEQV